MAAAPPPWLCVPCRGLGTLWCYGCEGTIYCEPCFQAIHAAAPFLAHRRLLLTAATPRCGKHPQRPAVALCNIENTHQCYECSKQGPCVAQGHPFSSVGAPIIGLPPHEQQQQHQHVVAAVQNAPIAPIKDARTIAVERAKENVVSLRQWEQTLHEQMAAIAELPERPSEEARERIVTDAIDQIIAAAQARREELLVQVRQTALPPCEPIFVRLQATQQDVANMIEQLTVLIGKAEQTPAAPAAMLQELSGSARMAELGARLVTNVMASGSSLLAAAHVAGSAEVLANPASVIQTIGRFGRVGSATGGAAVAVAATAGVKEEHHGKHFAVAAENKKKDHVDEMKADKKVASGVKKAAADDKAVLLGEKNAKVKADDKKAVGEKKKAEAKAVAKGDPVKKVKAALDSQTGEVTLTWTPVDGVAAYVVDLETSVVAVHAPHGAAGHGGVIQWKKLATMTSVQPRLVLTTAQVAELKGRGRASVRADYGGGKLGPSSTPVTVPGPVTPVAALLPAFPGLPSFPPTPAPTPAPAPAPTPAPAPAPAPGVHHAAAPSYRLPFSPATLVTKIHVQGHLSELRILPSTGGILAADCAGGSTQVLYDVRTDLLPAVTVGASCVLPVMNANSHVGFIVVHPGQRIVSRTNVDGHVMWRTFLTEPYAAVIVSSIAHSSVLVTDPAEGVVHRLDLETGRAPPGFASFGQSKLQSPRGIAVSTAGDPGAERVFVSSRQHIEVFTVRGDHVASVSCLHPLTNAWGLALSPNGDMLAVCNHDSNELIVLPLPATLHDPSVADCLAAVPLPSHPRGVLALASGFLISLHVDPFLLMTSPATH